MITNENEAKDKWFKHLELREGKRNKVYKDSLGYPTVGIGHLVLPEDKLKVGDVISDKRVYDFLLLDSAKAWGAAKRQAQDLGKTDWEFVAALASVNFQLGTGWPNKFKNTYACLKEGLAAKAIANLRVSAWNKQTPVRVQDFIEAIEKAYKK